jgi:hypothetical protein
MGDRLIPNDLIAEESLLGSMLLNAESVMVAADMVQASDFYSPMHGAVFGVMARLFKSGIPIDPVTVASELNNNDLVAKLTSLAMNTPSAHNVSNYASIVYKHSVARKMMIDLGNSLTSIQTGMNPFEEAARIEKLVSGVGNIHASEPESLTIYELADRAEAIAPVVIPGMMHQDYRTIVVAEEGAGKSLLLRTIATTASQGYHPFSHQKIPPIRALIIDLENPTQAITQTSIPFMNMLRARDVGSDNPTFDAERLRFFRRPGGIEIRSLSDKAELHREIAFHRPQLVCIGPIYKMYRRTSGESYEDSADEAMAVLDELRTKYGFALMMEHHAAKGKPGEKRDLSPMGSQRWMAWPEIGISLYKDNRDPTALHVKRYRGDRLSGVNWPDKIVRDNTWLVEGSWDKGLM